MKTEIRQQRKIRINHVLTGKRKGNAEKATLAHIPMLPMKLALKSEKQKQTKDASKKDKGKRKKGKYSKGSENDEKQTHVRIFGLNYDTTKEQVERVFGKCGKIVGIEFPVFEDSKRSKGFCGIEFENAMGNKVRKMDGHEADGRWLENTEGKNVQNMGQRQQHKQKRW